VETFHIASECKTAVYFERWYTGQLIYDTDSMTLMTIINSSVFLLLSFYDRFATTDGDRTRLTILQYRKNQIVHYYLVIAYKLGV
jgi:hypothetical protein